MVVGRGGPPPGCIRGGVREQAQPLAGARSPQDCQVRGPLPSCPLLSSDPGSRTFLSTQGAGPGLRRLCLGTWALLAQGVTLQHPPFPCTPRRLAPGLLSRPRVQLGSPLAPPAGHTHPLSHSATCWPHPSSFPQRHLLATTILFPHQQRLPESPDSRSVAPLSIHTVHLGLEGRLRGQQGSCPPRGHSSCRGTNVQAPRTHTPAPQPVDAWPLWSQGPRLHPSPLAWPGGVLLVSRPPFLPNPHPCANLPSAGNAFPWRDERTEAGGVSITDTRPQPLLCAASLWGQGTYGG